MADAATSVVWTAFDTKPWTVVMGPAINPVDADSYLPYPYYPSPTLPVQVIAMTCSQPYAAGLAKWGTGDPGQELMQFIGVDWEMKVDQQSLHMGQNLEHDMKACCKWPGQGQTAQNIVEGSAQYNITRDQWQISDGGTPGYWIDTGFSPGNPAPGIWTKYSIRYWFDPVSLIYSVLSITHGGINYVIPEVLRRKPMKVSNWGRTIVIQRQLCNRSKAASMTVQYRNSKIAMSTAPIPIQGVTTTLQSDFTDFELGDQIWNDSLLLTGEEE